MEAEKLFLVRKDFPNGQKTLDQVSSLWQKIMGSINSQKNNGQDISDLKSKSLDALVKEQQILQSILNQIPDDQKQYLKASLDKLTSSLEKIQ